LRTVEWSWNGRTIFWLSLELFILVFADRFDLRQAYGVFDGVANALECKDEGNSGPEP